MSGPILLALRIAMALALYIFLGWALLTLWRELRRSARQAAISNIPALELRLETDETYPPYRFTIPDVTIGRDQACQCCLDDKTISGQHARLAYKLEQWWIEDLNSTNGTFLNQEPVASPLVVTQGDQLRCGQVSFRIAIEERAAQPEESGV
jgi:hypothetical protein